MKVLVTGGLGYIGSHICVQLLQDGHDVVILDNLSNSKDNVHNKIQHLAGKPVSEVALIDIRDEDELLTLFMLHQFDAVIHLAGVKAVGESVVNPLKYYDNNVNGTLTLLKVMQHAKVKTIVFSSSATVYGETASPRIPETVNRKPTNPYGQSKYMVEQILEDLVKSDPAWKIAILRYFNPIGAHPSGLLMENSDNFPNNLMPLICQVAKGQRNHLSIFGNDYDTPDGTGIRDYIHVTTLTDYHVRALQYLKNEKTDNLIIVNLGLGVGFSVLDIISAFEHVNNVKIPYKIIERRAGDIAFCVADNSKMEKLLGNLPEKYPGILEMCKDSWNSVNSNN